MIPPFFMVSTSSVTLQSLRKIVLCVLAVGAKIWVCMSVFFCHALRPARSSFEGYALSRFYVAVY